MNRRLAILLLAVVLLAVFAQTAVKWPGPWLGTQVNFLPPLVVYAAVRLDVAALCLVAVSGGVWIDSLSANPLGVSVLPLYGVGLALHFERDLVLKHLAYAQFVLGLAASLAVPPATLVLLVSLGEHPALGWESLARLAWVTLAGGALTPVCFRLLDWLRARLGPAPSPSVSFRADREIQRGRF